MATKPRSEWSEAYRKRIESAERRGLTGPARRGHGPREHITRAERAREAGRLTEQEKAWLKRQQKRVGYDTASAAGKARWDAAVSAFRDLTPEERDEIREQQRQRQRNTSYASIYGPGYADELSPMYLSSRSGLR